MGKQDIYNDQGEHIGYSTEHEGSGGDGSKAVIFPPHDELVGCSVCGGLVLLVILIAIGFATYTSEKINRQGVESPVYKEQSPRNGYEGTYNPRQRVHTPPYQPRYQRGTHYYTPAPQPYRNRNYYYDE